MYAFWKPCIDIKQEGIWIIFNIKVADFKLCHRFYTNMIILDNSLLLDHWQVLHKMVQGRLVYYAPFTEDYHTRWNPITALGACNRRRIYIANFAIIKIATFWSYHLHLREKSRSFSFTKLRDFLVGSAHVRSQATCMQRMQYAWGPRISIHVSKSAHS